MQRLVSSVLTPYRVLNVASSALVAQSVYYYLVSSLFDTYRRIPDIEYYQVPHYGSLLPLNSITR